MLHGCAGCLQYRPSLDELLLIAMKLPVLLSLAMQLSKGWHIVGNMALQRCPSCMLAHKWDMSALQAVLCSSLCVCSCLDDCYATPLSSVVRVCV